MAFRKPLTKSFFRTDVTEVVVRRCSVKKMFLEIQRETPVPESLF